MTLKTKKKGRDTALVCVFRYYPEKCEWVQSPDEWIEVANSSAYPS